MAEMRHLLSEDSILVLRAVQAQSEDPEVVDSMTRSDLYTHLAMRTRLGASDAEIQAKVERWADMRDTDKLLRRANRIVRTKEVEAHRARILAAQAR